MMPDAMTASVLPAPRTARGAPGLRRAAIAIVGVCSAWIVAGIGLAALNIGTARPEGTDWRAASIGALAFFVFGALLALQRPANPLSWVALAVGITESLTYVAGEYAVYALLTRPGDGLPLGDWAQWVAQVLWMPGYLLIPTLLLLLFPDGRPPSPRWRWLAPVTLVVIAAATVEWAVTPYEDMGEPMLRPDVGNPVEAPALAAALEPVFLLIAPCIALSLASVVVRVRRSTGVARQQLRWFGAGVAVALLLLLGGLASEEAAPIAMGLALTVLPASVTVAVLRHGLWELGPVARRSVVAVGLSAAVLAVYGVATLVLGGGEVVATAIVAVLLLPLQGRLERFVNRLLYGDRDEPWVAVRRLGERLATPVAPDEVAREVSRALRLPRVTVSGPGEAVDAPAGTLALPLVFHGALVGTLVAGGREVGPADWRALEDLAPSMAASLHAARLADDLRASRERIVTAREEERRRLRADLHDDVGPSLAMLALRLDAAASGTGGGATPEVLRELAGQTRDTLAQVRQIVSDLRPAALADLGLEAALAHAVNQLPAASSAAAASRSASAPGGVTAAAAPGARLDVPAPLGPLPAATEVAAYRIVREALSNIVRHARATSCAVRLAREGDSLVVTVTDDGCGIAIDAPRGVGLGSMAERADELGGTLAVATRPDFDGTRIEARLPA